MATLIHQCPHDDCLADRMNFELHAISYARGKSVKQVRNFAHASCRACGKPVAIELYGHDGTVQLNGDISQYPMTLEQLGWRIIHIWPEVPKPRVPDHLPDQVAKAYLSAERNFAQAGMEEASAGSYGRALDVGTKLFAPDCAEPTLYKRIEKLAAEHRITSDLAEWAHAIRLIRNGALHDADEVSRDELVAVRGFTETVLTYLFTLPGMLRERQALTKEKPKG